MDELCVSLLQLKVEQRCETVASPPLRSSLTKVTGLFSAWLRHDAALTFCRDPLAWLTPSRRVGFARARPPAARTECSPQGELVGWLLCLRIITRTPSPSLRRHFNESGRRLARGKHLQDEEIIPNAAVPTPPTLSRSGSAPSSLSLLLIGLLRSHLPPLCLPFFLSFRTSPPFATSAASV